MSTLDINCGVLISFLVLFDTADFKATLNYLGLHVMGYLEWIMTAAFPRANQSMKIFEVKVSKRKSALKEFQFLKSGSLALLELEIEQICHVFRICLPVRTEVTKGGRI